MIYFILLIFGGALVYFASTLNDSEEKYKENIRAKLKAEKDTRIKAYWADIRSKNSNANVPEWYDQLS